jgi:deoxyribose-phosphate aldolase
VGALKEARYDYVRQDIATVVAVAEEHDAIVKVILETCLLTDDEIVKACELSREAGAAFVKTSTGFSKDGATAHHVALMKQTVGKDLQVKASGGIRDLKKTLEMIEAGADRIGASASVEIMKESTK